MKKSDAISIITNVISDCLCVPHLTYQMCEDTAKHLLFLLEEKHKLISPDWDREEETES